MRNAMSNAKFKIPAHLDEKTHELIFNGSAANVLALLSSVSPERAKELMDTRNASGETPLIAAVSREKTQEAETPNVFDFDLVKALIPFSDTDAAAGWDKRTALMMAFALQRPDCAAVLAPLTDCEKKDRNHETALEIALRFGAGAENGSPAAKSYIEAVKCVALSVPSKTVPWEDMARLAVEHDEIELLREAAKHCDLKAIRLENSRRPNGAHGSLLFAAIAGASESVAALLLDAGVDPEEKLDFADGATALARAIIEFTQGQRGKEGETKRKRRLGCMQTLARATDPLTTTHSGYTALMLAATNGVVEAVKILLACGHSPNTKGERGHTALRCALESSRAREGVVACMEILAPKTDPSIQSESGETTLERAIEKRDVEAIDILTGVLSPKATEEAMAKVLAKLFPRSARALEARELEKAIEAGVSAPKSAGATPARVAVALSPPERAAKGKRSPGGQTRL